MEWVETTGRTVEEAKDEALDRLGVDEQDAEFDVVEEPRPGLFGRMRGEARVRARVTPKAPPPKQERRERKRRDRPAKSSASASAEPVSVPAGKERATSDDGAVATAAEPGGRRGGGRRGARDDGPTESTPGEQVVAPAEDNADRDDRHAGENVTVDQQADIMAEFLEGLVTSFGYDATIVRTAVDEETVELNLEGEDLGLLIGPKGATLAAVQDLARTVVQRTATGTHEGRVRIDVSGYRQRRREALERFTRQVADQVIDSGTQKALEPMAAVDRKVVHDTVNAIDGVVTTSEGEEPRRRVVILPSAD